MYVIFYIKYCRPKFKIRTNKRLLLRFSRIIKFTLELLEFQPLPIQKFALFILRICILFSPTVFRLNGIQLPALLIRVLKQTSYILNIKYLHHGPV